MTQHATTACAEAPGRIFTVSPGTVWGRWIHPLSLGLAAVQAVSLIVTLPLYGWFGFVFDWSSGMHSAIAFPTLLGLALYLSMVPGRRAEWIVPEVVVATTLMLMLTHVLAPAQYLAAAFNSPLIDRWLAWGDSLMGVHVGSLASWTADHPRVNFILTWAYRSFALQLVVVIPFLGLWQRDRAAMWEYLFHLHACLIVTVAAFAIFPAACAFQYYGFQSTLDQTQFIAHFNGARDGSFRLLRLSELEGLISVPSFHTAGALIVMWVCRRSWMLYPLAAVNVLLICATFMSGAHYVVDVLASVPLVAASIAGWNRWGVGWLRREESRAVAQS
jgi:hypothetical protein